MPHLLTSGLYGMVLEHLQDYFHLKDSANGFFQLFQLCFHIAHGHTPPQIARVLEANHLLTMIKPSSGIHPIVVGEHCIDTQATFYVFNSMKLLQHFFLTPIWNCN
jgi:hypothetical protein